MKNAFPILLTNAATYSQTGDEMSKRSKFVFVTWVGPSVSVMKKAKMSTDKALMKDIIQVYRPSNFTYSTQVSRGQFLRRGARRKL
jgi:hypothetical protein